MTLGKPRSFGLALLALGAFYAPAQVLAQMTPFSVMPGAAAAASQAWGDQGCGYGVSRSASGSCDAVRSSGSDCQPGTHATSAPSGRGSGTRCVPN
jgi:hypothetical protein